MLSIALPFLTLFDAAPSQSSYHLDGIDPRFYTQPPVGSWLGWGGDIYNNRRSPPNTVLNSTNAESLVQKCFIPHGQDVSATPVVEDDIAYYPAWDGTYNALYYKHCETKWSINVTDITQEYGPAKYPSAKQRSVSRSSAAIDGDVLYFGTQLHALIVAVHKETGRTIATQKVNQHPLAQVTGSPTCFQGIVYLGSSSGEENAAQTIPGYICCSFVGNVAAFKLDRQARTLDLLWDRPMIGNESANKNFSGAAVWGSQPSVDTGRHQLYVASGNSYSISKEAEACQNATSTKAIEAIAAPNDTLVDTCNPPDVYQEAILALDLDTGHINWANHLFPLDAYNHICKNGQPSECAGEGPDADFGMMPTFVPGSKQTSNGQDMVVIGQKSGTLWALSADNGHVVWKKQTSPGSPGGGLKWGIAVDDEAIYYTAIDEYRTNWTLQSGEKLDSAAFGAAALIDGHILWETKVPQPFTNAYPSVANDVVLTGYPGAGVYESVQGNGSLAVLDKKTGKLIKDYGLGAQFWAGAIALDQWVMFGTGYHLDNTTGGFHVWSVGRNWK